MSLFGRALDVVSGFDYGNIQILYLAKHNPQNHNPILDNKKPTFFQFSIAWMRMKEGNFTA